MGSSKKQTVGYWYHPAFHMVLGKGPLDAVLRIRGGEVDAWTGEVTDNATIAIDAPNLWGGEEAEGGIQGDIDLMFGAADQMPNPAIDSLIGPDGSAHRGQAGLLFKGGRYGAMNPYPKPLSVMVRRILKGWDGDACWYPSKAPIGMVPGSPVAVFIGLDQSVSMDEITSNGQSRMENAKAAILALLDLIDVAILQVGGSVDIAYRAWSNGPYSTPTVTYYGMDATDMAMLKAIVSNTDSSGSTDFTAAFSGYSTFFSTANPGARRLMFFITDGFPSGISGGPENNALAAAALRDAVPGVSVHGINIDLPDTQYTAVVDNTPSDGVPVVEGSDPAALVNVLAAGLGGLVAINPAHLIYYSLTAANMQGEPVELINEASFQAAADRLYAERFGLCTAWDPDQETVEQFRQRICNVIAGNCTRSTVNGQWYLDLIRGDYDLGALPILTDDDILDFEAEPAVMDDAVNQVAVKWFDPLTKQARTTAPLHALGAVEAAGINAETIDYSAIPEEGLAIRAAARDLRARSTPLWRWSLTTNRRPHAWRMGTYFRIQAPKRGIADAVALVGDIAKGTLRSGAIKLVATQDVYAMPDTTYVVGQPPVPPPATVPEPITAQVVFEAPYVSLVGALSAADLQAMDPEAGYLMTAGERPAVGLNYQLNTRLSGGTYESAGLFDFCPTALLASDTDRETEDLVIASGNSLDRVAVGTAVAWGGELGRVDAIDPGAGTLSIARGCGDTVPVEHLASERLWFYDEWSGADLVEYLTTETAQAKLLTRTGNGMVSLEAALEASVVFDQRAARPYPPGQFTVQGEAYPDIAFGLVSVSGAHRDRVQQADQLVDTTAGDIGPEPGTTYTVRYFADGVLEHTETGITSFPTTYTPAGDCLLTIELEAVRDGLPSWQYHEHTLVYTTDEPTQRVTEADDVRVTEAGERRVME